MRDPTGSDLGARWDTTYRTRGVTGVSWFQSEPEVSLQLVEATGISKDAAIIDVGGGASVLADHPVSRGVPDAWVLGGADVAPDKARPRGSGEEPAPCTA